MPAAATATAFFVSLLLLVNAEPETGPPPELGPVPPADDTPVLRGAGARRLSFFVRYDCPNMDCPTTVKWRYRKRGVLNWNTELPSVSPGKDHFNSTTTFNNLSPETLYEIVALPVKENNVTSGAVWHFNSESLLPITALTCTNEVAQVRSLVVHSSGRGWLALSWIPPRPHCSTFLEYSVRYTTNSSDGLVGPLVDATHWRWVGGFWTQEPSRTQGQVIPCAAWPERHCLLIARRLRANHSYSVEIKVERRIDGKNSQPVETQGWTRDDIEPGKPEQLDCQPLGSRALKVSWRPPLRPGGRLKQAHLLLSGDAGEQRHMYINVTLQQRYEYEVKYLRPSTNYRVRVRFVSASQRLGALASTSGTTEPEDEGTGKGSHSSVPGQPLQQPSSPPPPPQSPQTASSSDAGDAWLWLGGVLTAFTLLPIAFLIGCRSGKKWASNSTQERKLVLKSGEEKRDKWRPDIHRKEEPKYYYATNHPPLNYLAAGSPPPRSPPPPTGAAPPVPVPVPVLVVAPEYAEPHVSPLSDGQQQHHFSWDAPYACPCDGGEEDDSAAEEHMRRASWQSSHHYEDLEVPSAHAPSSEGQDTLYSEAVSVSSYAEVGLPTLTLPPPRNIADLYAQVKKPPLRPK